MKFNENKLWPWTTLSDSTLSRRLDYVTSLIPFKRILFNNSVILLVAQLKNHVVSLFEINLIKRGILMYFARFQRKTNVSTKLLGGVKEQQNNTFEPLHCRLPS